jgi:hypothetical protein
MGDNGINDYKKCRQIDDNFDSHAAEAIRRNAHCLMERICSFIQSHKMPPLGKCPCCIAPAATMVDNFELNPKTVTKHNFYLAFLR